MSLQRRLTLYFVVIVILPLAAAGVLVQRVVVGEITRRASGSLQPALDSSVLVYNGRVNLLDAPTRAAVSRPGTVAVLKRGNRRAVDVYLSHALMTTSGVDFLILLDKHDHVLGSARRKPHFAPGFAPAPVSAIAHGTAQLGAGYRATSPIPVEVPGSGRIASVIGGFWLDNRWLGRSPESDLDLSIVAGHKVMASTARLTTPASFSPQGGQSFNTSFHGEDVLAEAKSLGRNVMLVASTPVAPIHALSRRVLTSLLGLLALALIGTAVLAYMLARFITQPLDQLAEGAKAIAQGRFDYRIPIETKDEIGQVAVAFNDMSEQLRTTITQLSSSRDQLQRAVHRVGETLRSTHDMNQMLESILNTAADAVQADGAVLWRFTSTRDELYPAMATGLSLESLSRIKVGEGIAGFVVERAGTILLPSAGGPRAARGEPSLPVVIAIPLYSQDRIMGVLATYRRDAKRPFSREDLDTVVFLAEQGGVAVENVLLHEEAQRLSLTDGLTGVWNRRYFQMQFRQVLATATRFDRAFSILMLDLDFFKVVNDTYGHQRGDAILIEFSKRVSKTLREIDSVARYGGEEFICLLSETDLGGAKTTADKILYAIRSDPFGALGEEPVHLTVSIGISSYPDHGDSFQELVEEADRALYLAKQQGRDRACVAGEDEAGPSLRVASP
jgi:diguanylate cyclase (GGDEF)-like protein